MAEIQRALKWWRRRALDIIFDSLHRVDTSAVVPRGVEDVASANRKAGVPYDPSRWRTLPRCLRLAKLSTVTEFTFIDIGCGKGKVLLSALSFPFKSIIGIDFSPMLCEIASRNVAKANLIRRRCDNIQILCCDAADWQPPNDPLIIFFNNPFNFTVMEKVLDNIIQSHFTHKRCIYLIFVRMSSSLPYISAKFSSTFNDIALHLASTKFRDASINLYHFPGDE